VTKPKRKEKHALDELKTQIDAIQHGVRLIRESGISEKALFLLIQRAAPSFGGYNKRKPSIGMIRSVIEGMDALKEYVFPEEEDDAEHD